jgi:tetratricopeptide (TPR) repeat protein
MYRCQVHGLGAALLALIVAAAPGRPAAAAAGASPLLGESERRGYEQWLHSLEQTIQAQQSAGATEPKGAYPFPQVLGAVEGPDAGQRAMVISQALTRMESTQDARSRQFRSSPFHALGMARSYRYLCEYDSALCWYDRAASLDSDQTQADILGEEALGTAIVLGDSLRLVQTLLNTLGSSRITSRQDEIILAYRYLLVHDDRTNLALLARKVDGQTAGLSDRCRTWHAVALTHLERYGDALAQLRQLITRGSLSCGLDVSQRTWVLTTIPDLLFLLDRSQEAGTYYRVLANCSLAVAKSWGQFQLANLDLLARRYREAHAVYEQICAHADSLAWHGQACAMVELAQTLQELRKEGEPYGADASLR